VNRPAPSLTITTTDAFADVPTTTLADVLSRENVMDLGIRPLTGTTGAGRRLAGPAFTIRCPPGDNLMVHAAVYRAEPGSVIVVDTGGDVDYAVAGGNVMAVAQRHGVAGLVVDGVIRDVAEAREAAFPVFGRGVVPIPGAKAAVGPHNVAVRCGGVSTHTGPESTRSSPRAASRADAVAATPRDMSAR
jgi:regulator of RNase E activity RraA